MSYANGTAASAGPGDTLAGTQTSANSGLEKQGQNSTRVALYRKLAAVMQDCNYIQRDRQNTFHNYRYASDEAIKLALHQSLVKHGLLFFPSVSAIEERVMRDKDGKESRETLTKLRITFRFVDVETGEHEQGEFVGSGADSGDKGCYKAITGAIKYILTSWFLIPTGDDPEAAARKPQAEEVPRRQAASAPERTAERRPWTTLGEMKRVMRQLRENIGETRYFEELQMLEPSNRADYPSSAKQAMELYNRLTRLAAREVA